ncbi:MAG: amino acid ABC transporter permease [Cyanobacteria bacterium P01_F01_bin.33]
MTTATSNSAPEIVKPPSQTLTPWQWLHRNMFDSWFNTALSVISLALVYWLVTSFIHWAAEGNWAVIAANIKLMASGTYPIKHLGRPFAILFAVMALAGLSGGAWGGVLRGYAIGTAIFIGLLAILPFGQKAQLFMAGSALATFIGTGVAWNRRSFQPWLLAAWVILLPVSYGILLGVPGTSLRVFSSRAVSGLLLTLLLAATAFLLAFPIGILLGLGRFNQNLPIVKWFCTFAIEFVRGLPLTTILFAAQLLVPLFLAGANVDLLVRAAIGLIMFMAVYVAEDIRGGLQAVSTGQREAARAIGLNPFQITLLVVLPQALRAAIPALVGEFLTLFKDTSLVAIIGLIDLLGAAKAVYTNRDWLGTHQEVLFFTAIVYFAFCYAMAYASQRLEKSLGIGER